MPPFIETGHAKNVANFADVISFCTGYGPDYNPVKAALKLPQLITLHSGAQASLSAVIVANTAFNNAVNDRMLAFAPLKTLSTRIINALSATDATKEEIKDANAINKKIQGKRAEAIKPPTDPAAPPPNNISASQQSYDQLVQHLEKLMELLQTITTYTPNEADLKIASLTTLRANLDAKTTAVTDAYTAVSNARIARDTILYKPGTGMIDIVVDVKQYVKSVFGAASPQYKQVRGIKFTLPR